MFESAAICAYLAEKFPEAQMAPRIGTPERGRYYQWMVYSIATLEPPVIDIFMNTVMLPEAERSTEAVDKARTKFVEVAQVLENTLGSKPFLLGERFSAADVMIGSSLVWGQFLGLLEGRPVLAEYAQRLSTRPAYQRASAD